MPSVPLYLKEPRNSSSDSLSNPLPTTLQTPSGLAILEIQGTIHAPFPEHDEDNGASAEPTQTSVGRLEFPLFDPGADAGDTKWMKRVYLYVGQHQRLTGEVKKLPKPLMVVSKREKSRLGDEISMEMDQHVSIEDELDILEVVKYKILFGGRPEPVSG